MLEFVPVWLDLMFIGASLLTLMFFYLSNGKSLRLLLLVTGYCALQSFIAFSGFYEISNTMPPRILGFLLPSIALIIWGLRPKQMAWLANHRNQKMSTLLHVVRVPVELSLFYLFCYGAVPELMTFEGRNFDILPGITAPFIALLFWKGKINKTGMLLWNWICLGLVLFIFVNGALSANIPIQLFAFDQPNIAVMFFPYVLLPAVIVPIVVFTHISDIILLNRSR
jgi:hypothetical protein